MDAPPAKSQLTHYCFKVADEITPEKVRKIIMGLQFVAKSGIAPLQDPAEKLLQSFHMVKAHPWQKDAQFTHAGALALVTFRKGWLFLQCLSGDPKLSDEQMWKYVNLVFMHLVKRRNCYVFEGIDADKLDVERPETFVAFCVKDSDEAKQFLTPSNGCGFCAAENPPLVCGKCRTVRYCSVDHQRANFKFHKPICTMLASVLPPPTQDVCETTKE